jgi:hypothetical protein
MNCVANKIKSNVDHYPAGHCTKNGNALKNLIIFYLRFQLQNLPCAIVVVCESKFANIHKRKTSISSSLTFLLHCS